MQDTQNTAPGGADPRNDVEDSMDDARLEMVERMGDDATEIALAAVDELAERASELEQVTAELDATKERLLRQAAEYQNYRRRTEEEKRSLVAIGKSNVLERMLDVADDFGRSLEAAEQLESSKDRAAAYQSLKQGVDLVYRKLMDELTRLGVEPIEAEGQPFNENEHEAMMQQPAPDGVAPNTVLQELQKGYRMGDRVLRHSKVIVAG